MKHLLTLVMMVAVALSGCTKKNKKIEYGLDLSETLRVNLQTEPRSLDWSKATDHTSSQVIDNIMAGLASYDLDDPNLSVRPELAETWESKNNASTWVFKLRKDVKWSDGKPFIAKHLVDGWQRLLNPETAAEYAYFLYEVKNAKAYSEGKIKDFSKVGVRALDDHTVQVDLNGSISFFPSLLTHQSTYPIRLDVIAKHGVHWTDPENMVNLGAYNLKVWDHDKAIVLERNPTYYGTPAKIKNILNYMIVEQSTALNLFDAGRIDILPDVPPNDVVALKKRPEYKGRSSLYLHYYGFNTKKKPFDNVNFRKAVSLAIDRSEVVRILSGGQPEATSFIPKGMLGYEAKMGMGFDVAKAKEYIVKSGVNLKTLPRLEIGFNTNENHAKVAENIQAQLKRNLGISFEIHNQEWKSYLDRVKTNAPAIYRMGWIADYPDPDNFLNLLTSYSDNNYTKWGNPKFDSLIQKGVKELNNEKRKEIYHQAQEILLEEDVPVMPLFYDIRHKMVAERVQGYKYNALDRIEYKWVSLK